jgi:hypothetical protein
MSKEFDEKKEMDKEELVYVVALMLDCEAFKAQINKLSKACLFKLFDGFAARGNAFSNIELNLNQACHEVIQLQGTVDRLERNNKDLKAKLKREVQRNTRGVKNDNQK